MSALTPWLFFSGGIIAGVLLACWRLIGTPRRAHITAVELLSRIEVANVAAGHPPTDFKCFADGRCIVIPMAAFLKCLKSMTAPSTLRK